MRVSILVCGIGLLVSGCGGEPPDSMVLRGEAMGTSWSVVFPDASEVPGGSRELVKAEIRKVEAAMSTWEKDSEISRFNGVPKGEAAALSEETAEVMRCAIEIWRESGGRFDVTVGSEAGRGMGDLAFDEKGKSLTKLRDGVLVDLSAIAKGYAVDRVARALGDAGLENYLVEIGGELRGSGVNGEGKPWVVGVERPDPGGGRIAEKVELDGMSIATSGNYQRREHLVDPKTGAPAGGDLMGVSVVDQSAMVADAWATALFVAGPDEGIGLADRHGIAVAFVIDRGAGGEPEIRVSKRFRWAGEEAIR